MLPELVPPRSDFMVPSHGDMPVWDRTGPSRAHNDAGMLIMRVASAALAIRARIGGFMGITTASIKVLLAIKTVTVCVGAGKNCLLTVRIDRGGIGCASEHE